MNLRKAHLKNASLVSAVALTLALAGCSDDAKDSAKDAVNSATSVATSLGGQATSKAESGSSAASSEMADAPSEVEVPGVGKVTLSEDIAESYADAGGEAKLGKPTAQPEKVGDGTVQAFEKGTIFSHPDAGTHLVQGEILRVYTANGGPAGELGFPTEDEEETDGGPDSENGGWVSEFEHGSIKWVNQGGGNFAEKVEKK